MLEMKGLQTAVLRCEWVTHPASAAAALRRCQMTCSEFVLARGLLVNSGSLWGEEARRQERVQPSPPARRSLSFASDPAPAVSRPP